MDIYSKEEQLSELFKKIDRSLFIDNENKKYAAYDEALSIGYGQTISMPSLVFEMTLLLDLDKKHRVLEIGTGSGYQTVMLAETAGQVYTVERVKELSWKALNRFMELGYKNVYFKIGDGSIGWPEYGPYDRIIVTAAAAELPKPLVEQLKEGGKMVIPLGLKGKQDLVLIEKDSKGKIIKKEVKPVRFVEFVGEYGWKQ